MRAWFVVGLGLAIAGCGGDTSANDLSTVPVPDLSSVVKPDLSGTVADLAVTPDLAMTTAPQTVTVMVGMNGLNFMPDPVTINAGDTVKWVWAAAGHTVTSGSNGTPDGAFCNDPTGGTPSPGNCAPPGNPTKNAGDTFSFTFPTAGSFPYFCRPHAAAGMTGTVTVN
jgi:plastocyanin